MILGQMRAMPFPPDLPLIGELDGDAVLTVGEADHAVAEGAHRHPHGALLMLRSGYVKSESAAGRWLIPAGHLCWVPPFAVHGGELVGAWGVRIYLAADLCDGLPGEPCVMRCTPLILAVIDRLAEAAGIRTSLSAQEGRLLGVLRDEIERAKSTPLLLPMPQDARLRRTAERWLHHPDDQSGLDELAVEAGMSRRSFTRNFKLDTGLPIAKWRQIARLMRGIDMLAAGKSVTETAFAIGYDSISSFVVLCQHHTGMSPKILARVVTGGGQVRQC